MRQLFIIEGNFLAECPRLPIFVHAEVQAPASYLWYCELCGEVYARAPVLHDNGRMERWTSWGGVCRSCSTPASGSLIRIPGSLWLSWDEDFLAALPEPVVAWELQRHVDSLERRLTASHHHAGDFAALFQAFKDF
jgi:hypothetical protein